MGTIVVVTMSRMPSLNYIYLNLLKPLILFINILLLTTKSEMTIIRYQDRPKVTIFVHHYLLLPFMHSGLKYSDINSSLYTKLILNLEVFKEIRKKN